MSLWLLILMANVIFMSAGGDHTLGLQEWTGTGGTVSVDGTVASPVGHTGPCRIKCDGGTGAAATVRHTGLHAQAGRRLSVWFQFSALPTTNAEILNVNNNANNASTFRILLLTTGVLQLHSGNTTNGTTTLSANTWYRIALSYTVATTLSHSAKVYLGTVANPAGALEISEVNAGTLPSAAPDMQLLGWNSTPGSGNKLAYYDDYYIDDGTDLADPGNVLVTHKGAPTLNTFTFDTTLGTGAVNERPLSTTNGRAMAGTGTASCNFNIQAAGVGDVDLSAATLLGYLGWIWATGISTDQITVNGTNTTKTLTTTASYQFQATTTSVYPSNAAGIGVNRPTGSATDCNFYEGGVLVAYQPGVAVPLGFDSAAEQYAPSRAYEHIAY